MGKGKKKKRERQCVHFTQQKAQVSLGQPTVLVVSDLQGHQRSMIFMSFESLYSTSY